MKHWPLLPLLCCFTIQYNNAGWAAQHRSAASSLQSVLRVQRTTRVADSLLVSASFAPARVFSTRSCATTTVTALRIWLSSHTNRLQHSISVPRSGWIRLRTTPRCSPTHRSSLISRRLHSYQTASAPHCHTLCSTSSTSFHLSVLPELHLVQSTHVQPAYPIPQTPQSTNMSLISSLPTRRHRASLHSSVLSLALLILLTVLSASSSAIAAKESLLATMMQPDVSVSAVDPAQCFNCGCANVNGFVVGGGGGTAWIDGAVSAPYARCGVNYPSSIPWRSGSLLDQIQIIYGPNGTTSGAHGGTGGSPGVTCSYAGAYIRNISIWTGEDLASSTTVIQGILTIDTNNQKCVMGVTSGTPAFNSSNYFAPGWVVAYFDGRAGSLVDQLTVHVVNPTIA